MSSGKVNVKSDPQKSYTQLSSSAQIIPPTTVFRKEKKTSIAKKAIEDAANYDENKNRNNEANKNKINTDDYEGSKAVLKG